jgi:hypothetical protein
VKSTRQNARDAPKETGSQSEKQTDERVKLILVERVIRFISKPIRNEQMEFLNMELGQVGEGIRQPSNTQVVT